MSQKIVSFLTQICVSFTSKCSTSSPIKFKCKKFLPNSTTARQVFSGLISKTTPTFWALLKCHQMPSKSYKSLPFSVMACAAEPDENAHLLFLLRFARQWLSICSSLSIGKGRKKNISEIASTIIGLIARSTERKIILWNDRPSKVLYGIY